MQRIKNYIESGILESYVLGLTTFEETSEIEEMAKTHPDIRAAIDAFSTDLKQYAFANAVVPDPTIKPFLMATIDYTERLQKGEKPSNLPALDEHSKVEHYKEWLNRPDMILPEDFKDVHAKIIGYTPEVVTAIVWIKDGAPPEVHDDEYEKFLIVEGTCTITIGDNVHALIPGDFLTIPLHVNHFLQVTSSIPCKAILQRVAA